MISQEEPRYAIAMSFVGRPKDHMLPYIQSMQAAAAMANNADILMVMQKSDSTHMTSHQKELFHNNSVKLVEVDWDTPPKMKGYKEGGWCGHQDFIRLHVLGMEGYDAIAYYDTDIEFQGDITPVLRCAASGKFLSTNGGVSWSCYLISCPLLYLFVVYQYRPTMVCVSLLPVNKPQAKPLLVGGLHLLRVAITTSNPPKPSLPCGVKVGEPLNVGFFAVKPDKRLLQASLKLCCQWVVAGCSW